MNPRTLPLNSPGITLMTSGVNRLMVLATDIRNTSGFFPKPVQAGRILQNICDTLAEAQALLSIPPPDGFTMEDLEHLGSTLGEAVPDIARIHEIGHSVDINLATQGAGPKPFFLVEALVESFPLLHGILQSLVYEIMGLHGASEDAQKTILRAHGEGKSVGSNGGSSLRMGFIDPNGEMMDGPPPPEVLRSMIEQLRRQLGGS